MAKFEPVIQAVLWHEGGYANDPDDPGGETNFGISKRSYPQVDIKNLTRKDAKAIYLRDFWRPGRYAGIRSQSVATKAFDLGVNMGRTRAARLLQTAVNALGGKLKVDGAVGPKTLRAVNALSARSLLRELRAQAAVRYAEIVLARPKSKKYLHGWMRRAVS